jgi:hypothetical protein
MFGFRQPIIVPPPVPPYALRRKWFVEKCFTLACRAGNPDPTAIAEQAHALFDKLYGPGPKE